MSPCSIWDDSISNYYVGGLKVYWETLERVARYQAACMTGDSRLGPFRYVSKVIEERLGTSGRLTALSIGCSEEQSYELRFMKTGLFSRIDVLDLSAGLLERQRQAAAKAGLEGLSYRCCDLNRASLAARAYDFIWAVGTVHHIERLEHLFREIKRAMKPRALLVLREYVGPSRLQFTDLQLGVINAILKILPERLRKTPLSTVKHKEERVDPSSLPDPSEAVRSQDILPVLRAHFPSVRVSPTGGTLLYPMLQQIAFNFENDPIGPAALDLLIMLERTLFKIGLIPSDFVFCVAAYPDWALCNR
jgi:SAM-dependent methyltransferase